jgi:hypothetical protein
MNESIELTSEIQLINKLLLTTKDKNEKKLLKNIKKRLFIELDKNN